ncbi:hypothetical protein TIFTF001_049036 [Ficus carica]|uniref:Uncharacterized protein n=1 Tax=Ficus carica TaxID=3494 RepID=A0AA88CN00_FICCA|nr:hypothetical protein TIFTF001_049036 [Ficus carica]
MLAGFPDRPDRDQSGRSRQAVRPVRTSRSGLIVTGQAALDQLVWASELKLLTGFLDRPDRDRLGRSEPVLVMRAGARDALVGRAGAGHALMRRAGAGCSLAVRVGAGCADEVRPVRKTQSGPANTQVLAGFPYRPDRDQSGRYGKLGPNWTGLTSEQFCSLLFRTGLTGFGQAGPENSVLTSEQFCSLFFRTGLTGPGQVGPENPVRYSEQF